MWELSENSILTFFAGEAQLFGALLGLLGLAFVRGAENVERNFSEHLNHLVRELMEVVDKVENKDDLNVSITSNEALGTFIDKYRSHMSAEKYASLKHQFKNLEDEISRRNLLSRKFKLNCWLTFGLIVAASGALLFPVTQFPAVASAFALVLFFISILALVFATLFFIEITKTTSVFVFGKSP